MRDNAGPLSPPLTASTKNFRESTHLIPTLKQEERPKSYEPPQLKLWVILPASLFMIALGVGLEVALAISNRNQGFSVKQQNVFKFASQQFLTSFFPILLVAPLGLLWESKNWLVKRYQPYINLARGDASAEDSLLLDYVSINTLYCVFLAFAKRHWIVFISACAGLATLLLQPLAGAIFDIQQIPEAAPSSVVTNTTRVLGLDPDRFQLTAFLAAAGYVLAAVSNGLPDPPFIHNNWAAADFQFPSGNLLNGTISVNTTGIRTNATCTAPATMPILDTVSNSQNYTISAVSGANCNVNVTFNPQSSSQQYGVNPVLNCGPHASENITFLPVFFWFYKSSPTPSESAVAGVFCEPTLEVFHISANASLNDGSLGNVTALEPINDSSNNVTGSPQNGVPFNGVIFDTSQTDAFTAARASAVNNGVPGAILRAVTTNSSLSGAFTSLDGFVDITSRIYTQHLALSAKNTYFLTTNEPISSITISLRPRLVIEPLAGHALSVLLIIIGCVMFVVGVVHRNIRRGVFLGAPPGSIASAVALTSHSGFGMFLVPYDTELTIAAKLAPLRFRLDRRSGAVVAVDAPGYAFTRGDDSDEDRDRDEGEKAAPLSRGSTGKIGSSASTGSHEDTRMSLLGHSRDTSGNPLSQSGYLVEPFTPPT